MRRGHIVALAVLALAAAGCGGGDDSSAGGGATQASSPGAEVFADAGCGNCHTLEAAGATGKTGPDLDDSQSSAAEVEKQVREGGGGMPSFEDDLSEEEIRDVAEFVASSAGG